MTREEHIENLKAIASDMPSDKCADWIESLMAGVKALEQVSSSEKPKMGKWIYRKEEDSYRCSLCGFPCHKDNMGAIPTKYCAECGAIMQEVEE